MFWNLENRIFWKKLYHTRKCWEIARMAVKKLMIALKSPKQTFISIFENKKWVSNENNFCSRFARFSTLWRNYIVSYINQNSTFQIAKIWYFQSIYTIMQTAQKSQECHQKSWCLLSKVPNKLLFQLVKIENQYC